ncbi:restriction endonuclease [Nocardia rhizosphaerihabitans]|nr:restriction endonuclease [Nocardia rhizosphaerihabitans]
MTTISGSSPDQNWRDWFQAADRLPEDATNRQRQQRGRQFEKFLVGMFAAEGLDPRRTSFRPAGEEIDGSIWFEGRTILFEAKWTADPHPASSIYQFKGKVDGKLVGTVGLFISMAGFSTDAVDALVAGKDVNVILADGDDLRSIVSGEDTAKAMLRHKLRAAGETGAVFSPANVRLRGRRMVFVEGRFDERILGLLREACGAADDVTVIPTGGPMNMIPLIESILLIADGPIELTAIIDGNNPGFKRYSTDLRDFFDSLNSGLRADTVAKLVVLTPDLDSAFGLVAEGSSWSDRKRLRRYRDDELKRLLAQQPFTPEVTDLLRAIGIM